MQDKQSMVTVAYNLSGALEAVKSGRFIVLVDVIDMSTTAEGLYEAGVLKIWGAAPDKKGAPYTGPYRIGLTAAEEGRKRQTQVCVIAEPRVGTDEERRKRAAAVLAGLADGGCAAAKVWPNLGAETAKFTDWKNKLAIIVSDAGGTIFDAVWQQGGSITTATVARTLNMKGETVINKGIERALQMSAQTPLTLIAASSNSIEDVLAVHYLAQRFLANY